MLINFDSLTILRMFEVEVMKNLVIVESPSKSKTIQKYLGKDYNVISRKGHISDLSIKGKEGLGVDVDDNFKEIIRQIYQRQTDNEQKKDLLGYIFDAYAELKESQQGKSFYAFWEFLLSSDLQKEWDELTDMLYKTMRTTEKNGRNIFLNLHIRLDKLAHLT